MILLTGEGTLPDAIESRLRAAGVEVERPGAPANGRPPLAARKLARARALVIAADDDAGNVDLALQARQLHPSLPLVVRLFDATLASYIAETLPGVPILSMSKVAAPVFAAAARQVLEAPTPPRSGHSKPARRSFRPDPILVGALACLFLLVFPSALYFSHALGLRYVDALYFVWTTVMTVGYGDISLKDAPDGTKLLGMLLMLAGAGFIAILFALLSDWVLSRRLDVRSGRVRERGKDHVVLAGAGNVGLRIAELLADSGRRLVIIEPHAGNRNVAALRSAGHHLVIADATDDATLDLAGVDAAALVVAVTDQDAANLQIALHARARGVPVIMRMVSPELSAHLNQRGDAIAFSPIAAAADAFVQAALSEKTP
ncbi:MAG: potassium channel protein [Methylococcaceae bacterium]|nr:potassium channel protein [Methylococcaceae bacterium]